MSMDLSWHLKIIRKTKHQMILSLLCLSLLLSPRLSTTWCDIMCTIVLGQTQETSGICGQFSNRSQGINHTRDWKKMKKGNAHSCSGAGKTDKWTKWASSYISLWDQVEPKYKFWDGIDYQWFCPLTYPEKLLKYRRGQSPVLTSQVWAIFRRKPVGI